MNFLQSIFQGRALTYEDFVKALETNGKVYPGNLQQGQPTGEWSLYEATLLELQEAQDTIADLQAQVEEWAQRYETDLAQVRRDAAIDQAILQAKGRNVKAIRALLDLDHIVLKEDGTLEGLDLESLKRSDSYLFEEEIHKRQGPGLRNGQNGQFSNRDPWKQQFEAAVWAR